MQVRAAEHGLREAKKLLDGQLDEWRAANGIRGGFDTSLGAIDVRHTAEKILFTDANGLLDWAKANAPHEVEEAHEETVDVPERVRPSLPKWLAARCEVVDGLVIDTLTGEELTFASVQPASDVLAARLTSEAKAGATEAILSHLGEFLALATPERAEVSAKRTPAFQAAVDHWQTAVSA